MVSGGFFWPLNNLSGEVKFMGRAILAFFVLPKKEHRTNLTTGYRVSVG